MALGAAIAVTNLLDSRTGRAIRSLKNGTTMAEAMGISTFQYKLLAFVLAAMLAAVSGWLFAHFQRTVNPSPFNLAKGIEFLFMAVLGGVGHVWGAFTGAAVVKLVDGANGAKYEIIAGERRFRAAKLAGLDQVPVLVRNVPDEAAAAMALIENMQREDLNPLEEAHGLQRLIKEFGLTHETAAQAVGRSRSAASNLLRLLNLADPVQTMLMAGDLDMGHARALLSLDRATQITAANQIAAKKMSVREAEGLVKKLGAEFALTATKPTKEKSRDLKRVEEELSDLLMAQVEIQIKKRVKRHGRVEEMGEVIIQFGSLDELNGLIERLSPGGTR